MQIYRVVAEVNWDAQNYQTLDVSAKSIKKAEILAEEELKKKGFSHIHIMSIKVLEQLSNEG